MISRLRRFFSEVAYAAPGLMLRLIVGALGCLVCVAVIFALGWFVLHVVKFWPFVVVPVLLVAIGYVGHLVVELIKEHFE